MNEWVNIVVILLYCKLKLNHDLVYYVCACVYVSLFNTKEVIFPQDQIQ